MNTPDPIQMMVLDDEAVQRMSVEVMLSDLGQIVQYDDPRPAIDYLRSHTVDVVIVDMRMPSLPVDGSWFLKQLREFDKVTSVVLRTADASIDLAQQAIEARAVQRVIKSDPNAKRLLREAVVAGANETREQRRLLGTATEFKKTSHQLRTVIERIDDEITVSELCRGFVQGLAGPIATVCGYAEMISDRVGKSDDELSAIARRNRAAAAHLSDKLNAFLHTPFVAQSSAPTTVNGLIDALQQVFGAHPLFGFGRAQFAGKGMLPDQRLGAAPLRLLGALRQLVEYCAIKGSPEVHVSASTVRTGAGSIATVKGGLRLNASALPKGTAVVVTTEAQIDCTLQELKAEFRRSSEDPLVGNLLAVGMLLVDDRLSMDVCVSKRRQALFHLYLPVPS